MKFRERLFLKKLDLMYTSSYNLKSLVKTKLLFTPVKDIVIATFQDLQKIPTSENGESLVEANTFDRSIICKHIQRDMENFTGERIFVREELARRLALVNAFLQKQDPQYCLRVVYGYRHPVVQEKYFSEMRQVVAQEHPEFDEKEIVSLTHNFIAVPEVAGHPTGGAIDATISTPKGDLDMGTKISDFSRADTIKTFAKGISSQALSNRILLRDAMMSANFAPFYGEWWHFCFGDREWAFFYGASSSLYSSVRFNIQKNHNDE